MASHETAIDEGSFGRSAGRGSKQPEGAPVEDRPGALLGWFVNFSHDSRGLGLEIRNGKFFIGRQALRDDDMVISDSAISTPHCLISASRGEGLKVQDLMSEQGTFLKRAGSNSFTRVHDAVRVEHGDWLRFGSYEVVVCLVP